jgi:GTPase SAR1 family protein
MAESGSSSGKAFVFSSLQAIESEFRRFYDLLARQSVEEFLYRAIFQEAEGLPVRSHTFRRPLVRQSECRALASGGLAADIDRVMSSFFRRLSGDADPALLAECFVTTAESTHADLRLAHIADELVSSVKSIGREGNDRLSEIIDRMKRTQRNAFVLLVGRKGAGKSTFVDRFFRITLRRELAEHCTVVRVNLADSPGNDSTVITWLDQHLLESVEHALFADGPPTYEDLQGTFFDEYTRWSKGAMKHLYETDKIAFKIKFGEHLEELQRTRPNDYMMRLVGSLARSRARVPCIVFDNADHYSVEFQEAVFRYARAIYEREVALVIVPVTDQTTWQLARSTERTLRSFESETLFLPTPSPRQVLEKRIAFVKGRIERPTGLASPAGYFFGRGIGLSIENLNAFAVTLQKVFLDTPSVSDWIADLSNWNIRACLELSKELVASPHLKINELLSAYIGGSALVINSDDIKRAILRGKYNHYYPGHHDWVHNLYELDPNVPTSPLLPLRLLAMLHDVQKDEHSHQYVSIDQVYDYFAGMGFDSRGVSPILQKLLRTELCVGYDPTVVDLAKASQIELQPSGEIHLRMAMNDWAYMDAMCQVTNILDKDAFAEMSAAYNTGPSGRRSTITRFVEYLISEDQMYCKVPSHEAYKTQYTLASRFRRRMLQRE